MKKILLLFIILLLSGCSLKEENKDDDELKYENTKHHFNISDDDLLKTILEPVFDIIKTKEKNTTSIFTDENKNTTEYKNTYYYIFDGYIEIKIDNEKIDNEK